MVPSDDLASSPVLAQRATELSGWYGRFASVAILVCTVVWWPLDPFVAPDARWLHAFNQLRPWATALSAASVLWFHVLGRDRHALTAAAVLYAAHMTLYGWVLGHIGPDGTVWFADAMLGIVLSAAVPWSPGARAFATGLIASGLAIGYAGLHPERRTDPDLPGQLSFLAFAAAATFLLGDRLYRVWRASEERGLRLDAALAGLAAHADRLQAEVDRRTADLRRLGQHLDRVQEDERRALSRDLHDDFGQELTAARLTWELLRRRVAQQAPPLVPLVEEVGRQIRRTGDAARDILNRLRPRVLEDLGLLAGLTWLVDRARASGASVDLQAPSTLPPLHDAVQLIAYRVAQEGLTNAMRHASATHLRVELVLDNHLHIRVLDDGTGPPASDAPTGLGLLGLRERVHALGGELRLSARPGGGSMLVARLPATPAELT